MSADTLLEVRGLTVDVAAGGGRVPVLDGVDFALRRGETLGIVGESGSGKTMLALALIGLLPPGVRVGAGEVELAGERIDGLSQRRLRAIRGRRIALMFQDASASLNPVLTVGNQLTALLREVRGLDRRAAERRALELLEQVEIRQPRSRLRAYPFELSGGMRQRILLAMALACEAEVLIADEPTTALDTVIQAQIAQLMLDLQREHRFGLLFISHDMRLVGDVADRVMVLYASRMAEIGDATAVLGAPIHPYTDALLRCVPGEQQRPEPLPTLPGTLPGLGDRDEGCLFRFRCDRASDACAAARPPRARLGDGHWGACLNPLQGGLVDD